MALAGADQKKAWRGSLPEQVLLGLGPGVVIVATALAVKTVVRPSRLAGGRDLTKLGGTSPVAAAVIGWAWTLVGAAQAAF